MALTAAKAPAEQPRRKVALRPAPLRREAASNE
jgi:hypothetical protein